MVRVMVVDDHPTSTEVSTPTRAQVAAVASRGPWSVSSHPAIRHGPPGAGVVPAKASARSRSVQDSSCTTPRPVSRSSSVRSASGSSSASTRAGSPAATNHDVTVSPACSAASPAVQSETVPPRRPRSRRTGSSGVGNGWPLWMVTRSR